MHLLSPHRGHPLVVFSQSCEFGARHEVRHNSGGMQHDPDWVGFWPAFAGKSGSRSICSALPSQPCGMLSMRRNSSGPRNRMVIPTGAQRRDLQLLRSSRSKLRPSQSLTSQNVTALPLSSRPELRRSAVEGSAVAASRKTVRAKRGISSQIGTLSFKRARSISLIFGQA
jgi:hypothetical protein